MSEPSITKILSQQINAPQESSSQFLDIPPGTRYLIVLIGIAGILMVGMGSLSNGEPTLADPDKVLHFSGYLLLGCLFAVGLRTLYWLPAALLLIGMGVVLEYAQTFMGRNFEVDDMYVNALGVSAGFLIGMIGRRIYAYIQTEISDLTAQKQTFFIEKDEIIFNQGDPSDFLYVVLKGSVEIIRTTHENKEMILGIVTPGEVFGEMGVIRNDFRYAAARAKENCALFVMSKAQLLYNVEGMQHPCIPVVHTLAKRLAENNLRFEELKNSVTAGESIGAQSIPTVQQPVQSVEQLPPHVSQELHLLLSDVQECISQALQIPKLKYGTVRNRKEFDAMALREGIELKQGRLLLLSENLQTMNSPIRTVRNIMIESIQTFSIILQYLGKVKEVLPAQIPQLEVLENEVFAKNNQFRERMTQLYNKMSKSS